MLFCDEDRRGYTIELGKIHETEGMKVFDFPYRFYDEEFKCDFEQKFIDHYYFDEIGFETIGRFKHHLKSRLNLRMPYYEQLYKTELAAEGIDFLLNKDLTEETIRELITEDKLAGSDTRATLDSRNITGSDITDNQGTNTTEHDKGSKVQTTIKDKTTNNLIDAKTAKNTNTVSQDTLNTDSERTTYGKIEELKKEGSDTLEHLTKDARVISDKEVGKNKFVTLEETDIDQTTDNNGSSTDNEKASNVDDGVASPYLNQQYLTGVSEKKNTSTNKEHTIADNHVNTTRNEDTDLKKDVTDTLIKTGTDTTTHATTDTTTLKGNDLTEFNKLEQIKGKTIDDGSERLIRTGDVTNDKTDITLTSGKDTDKETVAMRNTTVKEQTVKDQGSSVGENKEDRNGKEQEKTVFTSKGNIGVVSPADLLAKWRNIILNLDEMIILDCRDLFMGIF